MSTAADQERAHIIRGAILAELATSRLLGVPQVFVARLIGRTRAGMGLECDWEEFESCLKDLLAHGIVEESNSWGGRSVGISAIALGLLMREGGLRVAEIAKRERGVAA